MIALKIDAIIVAHMLGEVRTKCVITGWTAWMLAMRVPTAGEEAMCVEGSPTELTIEAMKGPIDQEDI